MTPTIVCLCGSTRFPEAFAKASLEETLAGKIVLSIGCNLRNDKELRQGKSPWEVMKIKAKLDVLHLQKIDMAHEVYILNVNGYVGESTLREIYYARAKGKIIRFLEPYIHGNAEAA